MNNFWYFIRKPRDVEIFVSHIDLPILQLSSIVYCIYENSVYMLVIFFFAYRQNTLYRIILALKLFHKEITTLAARDPRQMVL